jgi:hypothetical protein
MSGLVVYIVDSEVWSYCGWPAVSAMRHRLVNREIDAMKCLAAGAVLCLLVFPGLTAEVAAGSWTCRQDGLTRHVVVFYPEAPAQLPCKVFYSRPEENVMPRALWESENTQGYCEQKAAGFVRKLSSAGWRCLGDKEEQ